MSVINNILWIEFINYIKLTKILQKQNGDRSDAPNFAILLTDGQATVETTHTLPEAIKARVAGITLTVVALGTDKITLELSGMASVPIDNHLYMIKKLVIWHII